MALIYEWMPLAWLAAIVAITVAVVLIRHKRSASVQPALPVAHSTRLTDLQSYRRALARYRGMLTAAAALVALALVASITLSARPSEESTVQPDLASRDIVLCLDISGSMIAFDQAILEVFDELSEEFTGERISLVLFNASAVTYFPLSSDYDYIQRQFARLQEAFAEEDESLYAGTQLGDGSSLIGDGLASCTLRFDTPERDRSRSIIFATDNQLAGRPIFTIPEAGALAVSKGIRVYGINPGDTEGRAYLDDLSREFESVVQQTGGDYYALDDPSAIPGIVGAIGEEQAKAAGGTPQLVRHDEPAIPFLVLLLGFALFLVLAWRLRL